MTSHRFVIAKKNGAVMEIRLSRPDKLNALVGETIDALRTEVMRASIDHQVRSVLLTAEGRAFSVGDDLNGGGDRLGVSESQVTEAFASYPRAVDEILRLRKPIVAALHGAVFGAGLELALACDFRIATADVRLGPVYTARAYAGGTSLLPLYVGFPAAKRILLLGEPLNAHDSQQLGLLDEVLEDGADQRAGELADMLSRGPTQAYAHIKSALLHGVGRGPLEALHIEEDAALASMLTNDAAESEAAFVAKREALYRGN